MESEFTIASSCLAPYLDPNAELLREVAFGVANVAEGRWRFWESANVGFFQKVGRLFSVQVDKLALIESVASSKRINTVHTRMRSERKQFAIVPLHIIEGVRLLTWLLRQVSR